MTLLRLTPAMASHRGMRRRHNEDAVGYAYPSDYDLLTTHGALFIVADGVGGLSAGDKASKMVVEKLQQVYFATHANLAIDERLVEAIQQVNADVFHELDKKGATTLVAAVIHQDNLIAVSVGDSQIFRIQEGLIEQLNQEDVLKTDDEDNGALTKAIGYRPEIELEPIITTVSVGDKILLCSDGLTRYLDHEQLMRLSQVRDPRDGVRRMVNQANADGGADNITALLVFVGDAITREELAEHQRAIAVRVAVDTDPMVRMEVTDKPNTQVPLSSPRAAITEGLLNKVETSVTQSSPKPTRQQPTHETQSQPDSPTDSNMTPIIIGAVIFLAVGAVIFGFALASIGNTASEQEVPITDPTVLDPVPQDQSDVNSVTEFAPTTLDEDSLNEGDVILLEDIVLTMNSVNSDVSSFLASTDTPYLIDDILEDTEGLLWYRLLEEETDQTGWVAAADLPAYTVVRD